MSQQTIPCTPPPKKKLSRVGYLNNRSQYVQLDNVNSRSHAVTCEIPQGSVLGPLLFNIYINDIIEAPTKFDFIMYADDTTFTSTRENFGENN